MDDLISRQAAIDAVDCIGGVEEVLRSLPPAQPEQTDCEYCHEDSDGFVRPIEKNSHAFVSFGLDGWHIAMRATGWVGRAPIKFCPMCGRRLTDG